MRNIREFLAHLLPILTIWLCLAGLSRAGDLKILLPKHSKATPVQSLNRDGVEAIRKHDYEKAKSCFYEAYLLDPEDPFTLNNLGYIAEMEGNLDRAQRFYVLAARQPSDASVDMASASGFEGRSFQASVGGIGAKGMQMNRDNVAAVHLFYERRPMEADDLLQQNLAVDQNNPFTLNNLGVAKEMEGDFPAALKYYGKAAASRSQESAAISSESNFVGKPISEVAAENVERVRQRMRSAVTTETAIALLNLRGVSAINRNQARAGALDFLEAYKLDPTNAFTLNNLGYVAELDGDLETAQSFYESAQQARNAHIRIGLATTRAVEGLKLSDVAIASDQKVDTRIEEVQQERRRETGPIQLKRRDGQPVVPQPQPEAPGATPR